MCVTNSFSRFAYGLILPAMREDMSWTYAQAGWLNTANALGYLAGAVLTLVLINRINAATLFATGMASTAVALMLTGLYEALWWQTLWRFMAGFLGAMSFSTAGALTAQLFPDDGRKNALAIALLFGFGGGLGIVLAGAAIPQILAFGGITAWPRAWMAIGLASFAFLPLGLWAARTLRPPNRTADSPRPHLPVRRLLPEFAGYGAFGLGYIVYLTFLGAWMKTQATGPWLTTAVWVLLGCCISLSPFLWRSVFARIPNGVPLAMVLSGIAIGSLLPVLIPGTAGLILSALVFGSCVFMSPSAVTSYLRHNLPPETWGPAISLFTVVFAVTQTIGPIGAGLLGDLTGNIGHSLEAAAAILFAGALIALFQRPLAQPVQDLPDR